MKLSKLSPVLMSPLLWGRQPLLLSISPVVDPCISLIILKLISLITGKFWHSAFDGSTTFVPIHDRVHTTVPTDVCAQIHLSPDTIVPMYISAPTRIIVARYDLVLGQ